MKKEIIGQHTLYFGDCLEILPAFESRVFDVALTDAPYGIGRDKGFMANDRKLFGKTTVKKYANVYSETWDTEPPTRECFDEIRRVSKNQIIFGGNYFADKLPAGTHWIVWDKLQTMPTFSDCELIWTSFKRVFVKKIVRKWNGLDGCEKERYHPTQKPLDLTETLIMELY